MPPELLAADAVMNMSKEQWLKPVPAFARVRARLHASSARPSACCR